MCETATEYSLKNEDKVEGTPLLPHSDAEVGIQCESPAKKNNSVICLGRCPGQVFVHRQNEQRKKSDDSLTNEWSLFVSFFLPTVNVDEF